MLSAFLRSDTAFFFAAMGGVFSDIRYDCAYRCPRRQFIHLCEFLVMRKFLLKLLLFFACVVVMDIVFGWVFSCLRVHARGGSTANCEYIANQANDDIVIFGSSRATHHYIPKIIEDSLGVSCYNCGEEGNGIVLAYGRFKMLTNRYKPKLIIYEMTPGYDFGAGESNKKYLGYLRPYYDLKGIRQLFDDFDDESSSLKMKSRMFQNSTRLLPNVVDNLIFRDNRRGYSPLYGRIDIDKIRRDSKEVNLGIDSLKLSYIEKMIREVQIKGIPIIFLISPRYGGGSILGYDPEIELCKRYGVTYYSFINNDEFINKVDYFHDEGHMNNDGAIAYSRFIVDNVLNHYFPHNE